MAQASPVMDWKQTINEYLPALGGLGGSAVEVSVTVADIISVVSASGLPVSPTHVTANTASALPVLPTAPLASAFPVSPQYNTASAVPVTPTHVTANVASAVPVVPTTTEVQPAVGGIYNGRKLVASAGTAEAIAASQVARQVVISPITNNTGQVVIGGTAVVAASATRQGVMLSASSAPLTLTGVNPGQVFVDSVVVAEGVTFSFIR